MKSKAQIILVTVLSCIVIIAGVAFLITKNKNADNIDATENAVTTTVAQSSSRDNPAQTTTATEKNDLVALQTTEEKDYYYADEIIKTVDKNNFLVPVIDFYQDNSIVYCDARENYITLHKENEQSALISTDMKVLSEDEDNIHTITSFTVDENDNIYILYSNAIDSIIIDTYDKDKQLVGSDTIIIDGVRMVTKAQVADGKLYMHFHNNRLKIYSLDEKRFISHPFENDKVIGFDVDDNNIYVLRNTGQANSCRLIKANTEDYKTEFTVPLSDDYIVIGMVDYNNEKIFLATDKGIDIYNNEGKFIKNAVDFSSDTSFFISLEYEMGEVLNGFAVDSNDDIYIATSGSGRIDSHIYKLTKTDGQKQKNVPTKQIKITAAYKQDFLVDAVRKYCFYNKDVEVVWDVFYDSYLEFTKTPDDVAKKLATKLMTNDVGDIVATGGMKLVYNDVLSTDAFIDLSDRIKNDKNYSNLNKNALDGITLNGKITGLPIGIAYPFMVYNKELGDKLGLNFDANTLKWSDIFSMSKMLYSSNTDVSIFMTIEQESEIQFVETLIANMPQLIDIENKQVDLNQQWFIDLINDFKELRKKDGFNLPVGNTFGVIEGNYLFKIDTLRGQYDTHIVSDERSQINVDYIPMPSGEVSQNAVAYPLCMYSISENSQQKDTAWDILSYLLEEDIQSLYTLDATPINTNAEKAVREKLGMPSDMAEQFDVIENRIDYMYDMSYYKLDLYEPLVDYFYDRLTLEQALEKAEYNVWLRLNE